jgi:biopolymer transport protein ExbD
MPGSCASAQSKCTSSLIANIRIAVQRDSQMSSAQPQFKLSALRRKSELLCRIDMWGFVSVMLAMLFIFLPTTTDTPLSISVDWPFAYHSTSMPGALREDAMRISITRDGRIFFRDDRVACNDLPDEILKNVRDGAEKKIYLSADARAKYGDIKGVLSQIRATGIEDISFLTEQSSR